jgi:prepilin-type N-terminal cleavage/methylation domain-containing protein
MFKHTNSLKVTGIQRSGTQHRVKTFWRKGQRGFTLPELAIGIGVGLVLLAAALYGIKYFSKSKASNEIQVVTDLRSNVVSYGSRVGLFTATNSTLAALVGQNFFPKTWVSGTTAAPVVTNQWGGQITVAVGTVTNTGDSLNFTSTGIADSACSEISTSLDGVVAVMQINGVQTKANGAVTDPTKVACAGDNNTIVYTLTNK